MKGILSDLISLILKIKSVRDGYEYSSESQAALNSFDKIIDELTRLAIRLKEEL